MSHNPQDILRDLVRNPLHIGLIVACSLLSIAIITVLVVRESSQPAAKKKVHPLDKAPTKVIKTESSEPPPAEVPHASSFPSEIAILCERCQLQDWGKISEPIRIRMAVYLAASLHPSDSPYAHQQRSFFYFRAIEIVRDTKPDLSHFGLTTVCIANDHHFANYLASEAEAPMK